MKKIVVLGGGTGMSTLLRGLKLFPLDIKTVVSVSDDGSSTGILRDEFHTIAVGDIRKVIIALSETEPLFEELLNYRFETDGYLNGHAVGNLLLTALANIRGNLSDGIEVIEKILKLKGKVYPLTEDSVTLVAEMESGNVVEGEHHITDSHQKIKKVYYKENPVVNQNVIKAINEADLIILSMGSLYTSIIPNLLIKDVVDAIDNSKADIMYISNMMTQPGETDNFTVSDHVKVLNNYLGKRKINVVLANTGIIPKNFLVKYETLEQKDQVKLDKDKLKNVKVISDNYVTIKDNVIRHKVDKLSLDIYGYLIR